MNGIHEVTGSIPVWSTILRSMIQAEVAAPQPRSGEGGPHCPRTSYGSVNPETVVQRRAGGRRNVLRMRNTW